MDVYSFIMQEEHDFDWSVGICRQPWQFNQGIDTRGYYLNNKRW